MRFGSGRLEPSDQDWSDNEEVDARRQINWARRCEGGMATTVAEAAVSSALTLTRPSMARLLEPLLGTHQLTQPGIKPFPATGKERRGPYFPCLASTAHSTAIAPSASDAKRTANGAKTAARGETKTET